MTMAALAIWASLCGASLRAQMQDRVSFVVALASTTLLAATDFVALWALLSRFGGITGWSLAEIGLLYGVTHAAFGIANALGRGFDQLPGLLRGGDFDLLLLRPCPTVVQLLGRWFGPRQLGRAVQGVAVLGWAWWSCDEARAPAATALLAWAVLGGVAAYLGLFALQGALTFATIEGLEIANCVTYGGTQIAELPPEVFRGAFRRFFTFVVPLACVSWWPVSAAIGRAPADALAWAAPAAGAAMLALGLAAWMAAVRRYRSAGG
jgi:ABC-2 type transport system permease protein